MFNPKPPSAKIDSHASDGRSQLAQIALNRAITGRKEPFAQQERPPMMPMKK